jgi:hypothetical protein
MVGGWKMPFDLVANQPVIIAIRYEHSRTVEVTTNSPLVNVKRKVAHPHIK